jgi:hypothetical protein
MFTGLQHLGNVHSHDLNPLAEVRPSGLERFAADFLPVEKQIGHAEGGAVQGSATERSGQRKRASQTRTRRLAFGGTTAVTDPLGLATNHEFSFIPHKIDQRASWVMMTRQFEPSSRMLNLAS